MSSIQRWSNRPDQLNRSDVRIIYIRPVCFRSKVISSAIFDFFFGGTFCVATVWGCVYRVFRNLRKNARVRRKTKKEKSFILSIFSATAMARDAILTLKCAGHCPLAIGIFSFWIRRLNPEKIEKEQKISRTIYQKTNRIRRSLIDQTIHCNP
jgi:hypothetical protein